MSNLRRLAAIALGAILLATPAATLAQDGAEATPTPAAGDPAGEARLTELRALVPESLAGLPLREYLTVATGEVLAEHMSDRERAIFEDMLAANGKGFADYAGASAEVPITESDVVIVQPHRVTGIDASTTVDAWVDLLSLGALAPESTETVIAGRDVTVLSDGLDPQLPRIYVFAAADVVWLLLASDEAFVEEAVSTLTEATEAAP